MSVPSPACDLVMAADHRPPEEGGPCATCAFRLGTEANLTWHSNELARLCVEGSVPFECHEQPQLCRGFIAAMNVRGEYTTEDQKRWRECAALGAEFLSDAIAAGKRADDAKARA